MLKRKKGIVWLTMALVLLFTLAQVACSSHSVVISFSTQGGGRCSPIDVTSIEGDSVTLPQPTRDGYDFLGWYTDRACYNRVPDVLTGDRIPTASVTYYAGWAESTYTVTFLAGGEMIKSESYKYGYTLTDDDYPSLTAYEGYSWKKNYDEIKTNKTISAEYKDDKQEEDEKKEYTVTYYANGKVYYTKTGEMGTALEIPTDPTATGMRYFSGWSTQENGNILSEPMAVIGGKDVTYYAVFKTVADGTDFVTFETNGDGVSVTITGLTTKGSYQTEIGIPETLDGKAVTAIGFTDTTLATDELRVFRSVTLARVFIPSSVRTVGALAFSDCTALKEVVFNGSSELTRIGKGAFAGCVALENIVIPSKVTMIEDYAFASVSLIQNEAVAEKEVTDGMPSLWQSQKWYTVSMSLSSVVPEEGSVLSRIGNYAFYGVKNLIHLELPKTMEEVQYLSFAESGLTGIVIAEGGKLFSEYGVVYSADHTVLYYYPVCGSRIFSVSEGIKIIYENAFCGNINLREISFASSVLTLGNASFRDCNALTKVTFEGNSQLTTVGNDCFADCPMLASVTFPQNLVNFGESVFKGDDGLASVYFEGNKVTAIGEYAFYGCSALVSVSLPAEVLSIGQYAFYNCSNLASIGMGDRLTEIGAYAFCDCLKLEEAVIPSSVQRIGDYAFYGKTGKMLVRSFYDNDLENLLSIGEYAFCNNSLTQFKVPSTLKKNGLGKYAFKDCTALSNFSFNTASDADAYDEIPEGFLQNCTALSQISFQTNIVTIGDYALKGCSGITKISFSQDEASGEQKIKTIGKEAFADCIQLASNTGTAQIMPTSVTSVGEGAFRGCVALTAIFIPEFLTALPKECFADCTSLQQINYVRTSSGQSHLTTIGESCFARCEKLGAVFANGKISYYVDVPLPESLGLRTNGEGFVKNPFVGCPVAKFSFPNGNLNRLKVYNEEGVVYYDKNNTNALEDIYAYPTAKQAESAVSIDKTVQIIEEYAFYGCKMIELLFTDNGSANGIVNFVPVQIGDYAFAESDLKTVTLSTRVVSVGAHAFEKCNLESLAIQNNYYEDNAMTEGNTYFFPAQGTIKNNTLVIGDYAFYATTITTVTIPQRVSEVGEGAFRDCYGLTEVDLSEVGMVDGDLVIGEYAFSGDNNLTAVTLPARLVLLGDYAFYACYNLETVLFATGANVGSKGLEVGAYAFSQNHYLYELELPSNIETIGKGAFSENTRLKYFYFPTELTVATALSIPEEAFLGDGNLYSLTIPGYIDSIGAKAYYRTLLAEITFESGKQELRIEENAFAEAGALTTVVLPDNLVYIGEKAFYGSSLQTIGYGSGYYTPTKLTAGSDYKAGNPVDGVSYKLNIGVFTLAKESSYLAGQEYYHIEEILSCVKGATVGEGVLRKDGENYILLDEDDLFGFCITVGKYAFADTNLTEITLDSRFDGMEEGAFAGSKVTRAVIDCNGDTLAEKAFFECTSLKEAVLGQNILYIEKECFSGSGVTTLSAKTGTLALQKIGDRAFTSSALTSLTLSSVETEIGTSAFENCSSLQTVSICCTAGDLVLSDFAFGNCAKMTELILRADTVTLGTGFAYSATSLYTGLSIVENNVDKNYSYDEDTSLLYSPDRKKLILYPAGKTGSFVDLGEIEEIGEYAFYGNTYLTGVLTHKKEVALGANAFGETNSGLTAYVPSVYVVSFANAWGITTTAYKDSLNGFVLTVQNSGEYYITSYLGEETNLVIPGSISAEGITYVITGIAKEAFMNNKLLRTVVVSSGIKIIGNSAFRGCTALEKVSIGENVTGIKNYAFYGCTGLKEIVFADNSSVGSIGSYAFATLTSLESIALPERLETISSYAFATDTALKHITFGNKLLQIDNNAFEGCIGLSSIDLPSSITTLASYLFRGCKNLIYIHMEATEVPSITDRTFSDVGNAGLFFFVPEQALKAYGINNKWRTYIDKIISSGGMAENLDSEFGKYVLELISGNEYKLVAYIGSEESVSIASYLGEKVLTTIGENAFGPFVKHLVLEGGITEIEKNAFTYAVNLEDVVYPLSVQSIGSYAFAGLTKLKTVSYYQDATTEAKQYEKEWAKNYNRYLTKISGKYTVASPVYSSTATYYKKSYFVEATAEALTYRSEWSRSFERFFTRNNGVYTRATETFNPSAIYYKESVDEALTEIGDHAFFNCTLLTEFVLPSTVNKIKKYAFSCDSGKNMSFTEIWFEHPEKSTVSLRIEDYAFARNNLLFELNINCPLSYLGEGAFSDCSNLMAIYLRYSTEKTSSYKVFEVSETAKDIFKNCNKLLLVFPSQEIQALYKKDWTQKGIKNEVYRLTNQKMIYNDFAYSVYDSSKYYVTILGYLGKNTVVTFPSNIKTDLYTYTVVRIGREENNISDLPNGNVVSDNVKEVVIPGTVSIIGADSFYGCKGLERVTVQERGLLTVEAEAFLGCISLTTVFLPQSVTSVGERAFYGCTHLTGYTGENSGFRIEDKASATLVIGDEAFSMCENMTSFRLPQQLKTLGNRVFALNKKLTSVRYDDSYYSEGDLLGEVYLETVGQYAFLSTAIDEIRLPATTVRVGSYAFADCQNLMSVYLYRGANGTLETTETDTSVFGMNDNGINNTIRHSYTKVYVPSDALSTYERGTDDVSRKPWSQKTVVANLIVGDFAYKLIAGTAYIALTAYRGTETELEIPTTVVINSKTYYPRTICTRFGTQTLKKVTFALDSRVTTLEDYAFAGCGMLTEIRLPGSDPDSYIVQQANIADNPLNFGERIFDSCASLTDVHLPIYMEVVPTYFFYNCTALQEVTLPETVTEIGTGAFRECTGLARVRVLFSYKNGILGNDVFVGAGKNVVGGLKIIAPTATYAGFSANWSKGTNDYFTVCSAENLFGDYLIEKITRTATDQSGNTVAYNMGYTLRQYLGEADEIVLSDLNMAGEELSSVALSLSGNNAVSGMLESAFCGQTVTVRYGLFTLETNGSGWKLLTYEGTEDLTLDTFTVLGRQINALKDGFTADANITGNGINYEK